jgi:predicted HTH transcriptional regulator
MLSAEQFADLVTLRHELRGVEFKPPGRRDDSYLFAQVTRAALGMANSRDGGIVIVGVEERSGSFAPIGLSADEVATWRYDDVAARFASYADPPFSFALNVYEYDSKLFVALEIEEFAELPVVCRIDFQLPPASRNPGESRAGSLVLRAGACSVRSHRKPETSEIPGQTEMRELLNLAIEKGVRRYLEQARAVGLLGPAEVLLSAHERFRRQRQDLEGES